MCACVCVHDKAVVAGLGSVGVLVERAFALHALLATHVSFSTYTFSQLLRTCKDVRDFNSAADLEHLQRAEHDLCV